MTVEFLARRKNGFTYLRIADEDVHGVRVAMEPCPCRAPKSNNSAEIRKAASDALAAAISRPPES